MRLRVCGVVVVALAVAFGLVFRAAGDVVVETVVPGSPAAEAGVQEGDYLVSHTNRPMPSPQSLSAVQANLGMDLDTVELHLRRGQETLTLFVPRGKLGIGVRPVLSSDALALHEEARAAPLRGCSP